MRATSRGGSSSRNRVGALRSGSLRRAGPGLEEAAEAVALDVEADHPRRAVNLVDRLGRDESPAAREQAGADGERVGGVRSGAVHRALHAPDDAAAAVCDEKTLRAAEVVGNYAHIPERIPGL